MPPKDNQEIKDYLARIRKTISESEALVSQAELRVAETDRFLASQGLTREQVRAIEIKDADRPRVNEELRKLGLPPLADDEARGSAPLPPAEDAFTLPDTQGDLDNRRRRFGALMHEYRI